MSLFGCGRIELIIGPMFAGKTTELMRRVKREIHARRRCFVIKYANDIRYDDKPHVGSSNSNNNQSKISSADSTVAQAHNSLSSHDKAKLRARASVRLLSEIKQEEWIDYDVIAIDEGQFFNDLIEFATFAANKLNKVIMISALDGDYKRNPFKCIVELIPHCESVSKLTAVCMVCHSAEASFTRRTVKSDARELIGGPEMYIATCRKCYDESLSGNTNEKACNSSSEVLRLPFMQDVRRAMKEVEEECHVGNPLQNANTNNNTHTETSRLSTEESAAESQENNNNNNSNEEKVINSQIRNEGKTNASSQEDKSCTNTNMIHEHGDSPSECTNAANMKENNNNNNNNNKTPIMKAASVVAPIVIQTESHNNVNCKSPATVILYDDGASPTTSHDNDEDVGISYNESELESGNCSLHSNSHQNSPQAFKLHDNITIQEFAIGVKRMRSDNDYDNINADDDDDNEDKLNHKKWNNALPLRDVTNAMQQGKAQPTHRVLATEENNEQFRL